MSDDKTDSTSVEPLGIGERLRNAREARRLSLAAMEKLTKIRAAYLQALEDEQFDRLPGRIYARGFLRTYAVALGFNPNELLEAYDRAFVAPVESLIGGRATEIPIRPATPRSRIRRIVAYVGAALALVTLVIVYVGVQQVREFSRPASPSPPRGVKATPQAAPSPAPPPAPPSPAPPVSVAPATPPEVPPQTVPTSEVRLEVRASGRSWLRVIVDGNRVFEDFTKQGDVLTWTARKQVTVTVGYTPAVAVLVNGQPVTPSTPPPWEATFSAPQ